MDQRQPKISSPERSGVSTVEVPDSDRGASLQNMVRPGAILGGRYVVESMLGVGGMGCVVVARHLELDQRVAIKLLLAQDHVDGVRGARLLREARAAVRIRSEHVVRVYDVVTSGPEGPYIVMEYLEGESLGRRLRRKGRLGLEESVEIIIQASEAVGEAHRLDIVHRDLKPANLQLVPRPGRKRFVKVLDFGISKMVEADAGRLTQRNSLLGSPAYAPPEQLESAGKVSPRSDIWSLGVVLYECLTGELPYDGETLADLVNRIFEGTPTPMKQLRPEIPDQLEHVVSRCLERDADRRWASVEDLVAALSEFAPDTAKSCPSYLRELPDVQPEGEMASPDSPSHRGERTLTATNIPVKTSKERATARRRRVFGMVAASLGAVTLIGAALSRRHSHPAAPPSTPGTQSVTALRASAPSEPPRPPPAPAIERSANVSVALPAASNASPLAVPTRKTVVRPRAIQTTTVQTPPRSTPSSAPSTPPPWVDSR